MAGRVKTAGGTGEAEVAEEAAEGAAVEGVAPEGAAVEGVAPEGAAVVGVVGHGDKQRESAMTNGEESRWSVEGLAVAAMVLAVVSLLVPFLPAIAALVLAAVAARRIRLAPLGTLRGRGLVTGACALSTIGLLVWVGLTTLVILVTPQRVPTGWQVPAGATAAADRFSEVTAPPAEEALATKPSTRRLVFFAESHTRRQ
jgi:hypothetical protein